jgi:hypothetical protein
MFPPEGVSKAPCIPQEVAMTTPRTNTIGETISAHDGHEDCPPVGRAQIIVDAVALRQVLEAITGPSHHIRELQATRSLHALGHPNPIDTLIDSFNAAIARTTGANP